MKIRHFENKDRDDIRRICLETCSDEFLRSNTQVLWAKYADYYMDYESDTIFVAVDDNDKAQGYILCATDAKRFKSIWNGPYKNKLKVKGGFIQRFYQRFSEHEFKSMSKKGYSAHMHIDISPSFQRQGAGRKLVDALVSYLSKNKLASGIYLGCGNTNIVGNSFYKKYGFTLDHKIPGCNIYVKTIND